MPRGYVAAKIRANTARRNGDYSQMSQDDLVAIWLGSPKGNRHEAEAELRRRGATDEMFDQWFREVWAMNHPVWWVADRAQSARRNPPDARTQELLDIYLGLVEGDQWAAYLELLERDYSREDLEDLLREQDDLEYIPHE